ncbi:hypothetical protein [Bacillus sp. S14(2024)]|uniref:hypothetical protein n=1 Tax=Bacillus sp. S14(2024) TaxID=3162884 RepID=UPI003D2385C3
MINNEQFDRKLEQFLLENSLLPLTSKSWSSFNIDYKYNENDASRKGLQLKNKVVEFIPKDKRGVYVFVDSTVEEVVYVGEGWIQKRIHKHIEKLYKDKPTPRINFFKSIQGNVRIYWTKCTGYHRRLALEGSLQCVLKPRYRRDDQ